MGDNFNFLSLIVFFSYFLGEGVFNFCLSTCLEYSDWKPNKEEGFYKFSSFECFLI
jgi:hypothetical protein